MACSLPRLALTLLPADKCNQAVNHKHAKGFQMFELRATGKPHLTPVSVGCCIRARVCLDRRSETQIFVILARFPILILCHHANWLTSPRFPSFILYPLQPIYLTATYSKP